VALMLLLPTLLLLPNTSANRIHIAPRPIFKVLKLSTTHFQDFNSSPIPVFSRAAGFAVSLPLSKLVPKERPSESMRFGKVETNEERSEKIISPPLSGYVDLERFLPEQDTETAPALVNMPSTLINFEGLSNQDNADVAAIRAYVFPPDTVGDVGPTQYVQATNLLFRVFDKTGVPLTDKAPISSLFSELGPPCSAADDGDPIVLYDSLADRWIITQFMVSGALPFSQCFAISQTADATGSYYLYRFTMPNQKFNDYPKFGVWPDGYYLSNNQFNLAGTAFLGVGAFAFDRAKILAGDPSAGYIYFDLQPTHPRARGMLPSDADGLNPPPAGAPNVFAYFNANEFAGDAGDSLRLFDFHADFTQPANSTFRERRESPLPVAPFNPLNPVGFDDIEQPPPSGPSSSLDSISDRLMYRLQYRNFGAYEALTTNHTVNVGTGNTLVTHQAGIRYYELRRSLPTGAWTVREQATFAPDAHNRWMGSAAMDNQGNLAVGYSISSTQVSPGIRYAGRLANDPPGGLFQGEASLLEGTGVQTNNGSRWGDYSSMSVDPVDDCSFWYTQQYYETTDISPGTIPFGVNWQTRVGSFKFPGCARPAQGTLQVNVTDCSSGLAVQGVAVSVDRTLFSSSHSSGFTETRLAPGDHFVSVAKDHYLAGAETQVSILDGETTVLNVCVHPLPLINSSGATLSNESCLPRNAAIDPGERVTVNFRFHNIGAGRTANLVATLQPTGEIIGPSRPQSLGEVKPNETVGRDFSFTASGSCGDSITALLQLQDGEMDLGTFPFTFSLGPTPLTQGFDNVSAPTLPENWVASQGANPIGFGPWASSNSGAPSPSALSLPNAAFTRDPNNVLDNRLDSPRLLISAPAQLSFQHNFVLEENTPTIAFDAGVLEISINDEPFTDIIEAGGSFVQGGYNKIGVDPSFANPLPPERPNWSGNSNGFITTIVNLPQAAIGKSVVFRWRMCSDNSVSGDGWRVDNIKVTESSCLTFCHTVRLIVATTLTRVDNTTIRLVYRLQNIGSLPAQNIVLLNARLGAGAGAPLPQELRDLSPGEYSEFHELSYANSSAALPGTISILGLSGTYTGGTFSSFKRVVVP